MKVETDKDIVRYVKDIMRVYRFENIFDIYLTCLSQSGVTASHKFNFNVSNIDELVGKMFDFSMSKRVSEILAYGSKCGYLSAFEIVFSESSDHQTNITPRMIDFFRMIVDPFSRDILAEALRPLKPQPMEEDDYLNWNERFIAAPMVETNPWEYFECEGDGYV
jgi:hypothetical protein